MSGRLPIVLLNVVGGALVLASYVSVFGKDAGVRAALWGGVPDALRPLYTVDMFLAAAGYFAFSWLLLFSLDRARFRAVAGVPYGALHLLYGLVLFPSALWLPLTVRMIEAPDPALWIAIRVVLFAVAAGALGIAALTIRLARARNDAAGWVAVAGALAFVLQTAVLDALVWPAYW